MGIFYYGLDNNPAIQYENKLYYWSDGSIRYIGDITNTQSRPITKYERIKYAQLVRYVLLASKY